MVTILNKHEAADILGVSSETIDRLRRSGALPYRKIGALVRFLDSDIQEFIENSKVKKVNGVEV